MSIGCNHLCRSKVRFPPFAFLVHIYRSRLHPGSCTRISGRSLIGYGFQHLVERFYKQMMPRIIPHIVLCVVWALSSVGSSSLRRRTEENIFAPRVQDLVLINAETNQPIRTLQDNVVVNAMSQFTIEAITDSATTVGSVQFGYNGNATFRVESIPPFALCGDLGDGRYMPCPPLGMGRHTITATPFAEPYARGTPGATVQIRLEVANGCSTPMVRKFCRHISLDSDKYLTFSFQFVTSKWEDFSPSYPVAIREAQGLMMGNDLVVFGGFYNNFANVTNHTYALDVTVPNSLWRRMDDLPLPIGITHAAYTLVGATKVYICGGYSAYPAQHIPYCFVYDHARAPGRRQWTRMAPLPKGGSAGGGMIYDAVQNALYYTGGRRSFYSAAGDVTIDSANAWKYSFAQSTWVASTPLPYKANHLSSVTYLDTGGTERHFLLGGQKLLNESGGNLAFLYEFLPSNETWVRRASMPMARGHFSASTRPVGCGFLIAGGSVNSATRQKNRTSDISYYDVTRNRWSYLGNLPLAEPTPIVTLHNGYLHFVANFDSCKRRPIEWT
jgi:hypothetical protein